MPLDIKQNEDTKKWYVADHTGNVFADGFATAREAFLWEQQNAATKAAFDKNPPSVPPPPFYEVDIAKATPAPAPEAKPEA